LINLCKQIIPFHHVENYIQTSCVIMLVPIQIKLKWLVKWLMTVTLFPCLLMAWSTLKSWPFSLKQLECPRAQCWEPVESEDVYCNSFLKEVEDIPLLTDISRKHINLKWNVKLWMNKTSNACINITLRCVQIIIVAIEKQ
jgi:hypothetical protein